MDIHYDIIMWQRVDCVLRNTNEDMDILVLGLMDIHYDIIDTVQLLK